MDRKGLSELIPQLNEDDVAEYRLHEYLLAMARNRLAEEWNGLGIDKDVVVASVARKLLDDLKTGAVVARSTRSVFRLIDTRVQRRAVTAVRHATAKKRDVRRTEGESEGAEARIAELPEVASTNQLMHLVEQLIDERVEKLVGVEEEERKVRRVVLKSRIVLQMTYSEIREHLAKADPPLKWMPAVATMRVWTNDARGHLQEALRAKGWAAAG